MKIGRIRPAQAIVLLLFAHSPLVLVGQNSRAALCALPCTLVVGAVLLLPFTAAFAHPMPLYSSTRIASVYMLPLGLYFAAESADTITQLCHFAADTELPVGTAPWMVIAVLTAAVYGAWLGLESCARTAGLLAFFALIGGLFLLLPIGKTADLQNMIPSFLVPQPDVWNALRDQLVVFGNSAALLAVFQPCVPHYRLRHTLFGLLGSGLMIAAAGFAVCAALGESAPFYKFPLYTAAQTVSPQSVLRPESIWIVLQIAAVYTRCTILLLAAGQCVYSAVRARFAAFSLAVVSAVLFVLLFFQLPAVSALWGLLRGVPAALFGLGFPLYRCVLHKAVRA